jgi:hypothetical protein
MFMDLNALADVRTLIGHLPKETRRNHYVCSDLSNALFTIGRKPGLTIGLCDYFNFFEIS